LSKGRARLRAWLNKRLPVDQFMADQLTGYYAPKNFNVWYFFGSLALLVFVMQIVTGIFITMHYKPGELTAFNSVEYLCAKCRTAGCCATCIAVARRLLHRGLPAHGARAHVRQLQGAARAAVGHRHRHLLSR
jgi:hypothetical protein